jgi:CRISPR-associated protein Cmr2
VLVVVTAGGVQRFINEARTTADMRNGSVLYSLVMSRVVSVLTDAGADVILPAPREGPDSGVPNRVVAETGTGGADLARRAVGAAEVWWRAEASRVLGEEMAARVPQPPFALVVADGEYSVAWPAAQRALAARKRVRAFAPLYEEAWALCALSGRAPAERARPGGVRGGGGEERLSAEGWFKRGFEQGGFPSTRTVAAAWYRLQVVWAIDDNSAVSAAAAELAAAVKRIPKNRGHNGIAALDGWADIAGAVARDFVEHDGQWCSADAWRPERLVNEHGVADGDAHDVAVRGALAADRLRQAMADRSQATAATVTGAVGDAMRGGGGPGGYLALVIQDLDLLGWRLSQRPERDRHRRIGVAIAECARRQRADIESDDLLGRVVYAGGDDLVAIVPAESALDAAARARTAVSEHIIPVLPGVTASTAVAFFPAGFPFQSAVRRARSALHEAKVDRDSVAVVLLRGGGERDCFVGRWFGDDDVSAVTRLRQLVDSGVAGARLSGRLRTLRPSITDLGVLRRELGRQLSRSDAVAGGGAGVAEDLLALCAAGTPDARAGQLEAVSHLVSGLQALGSR